MEGAQGPCIIEELYSVIEARLKDKPRGSYTAELAEKGVEFIARKFGEEAVETIVAALSESRERLAEEAVDTLYHLLVLLAVSGVRLDDIKNVYLMRRKPRSTLERVD